MFHLEEVVKPEILELSPYQPGKPVSELQRELGLRQIIKLASNENPHGPCPAVIDFLSDPKHYIEELSRYPDGSGFYLKNKIKSTLGINSEQITLGNGSNDVLDIICRCFAGKGDEVIFSEYAFAVYPIATQAAGATAVVAPASNWGHDLQALLEAVSSKTRLIFIANPNNPTGTYLPRHDLLNFLQQLPEQIIVVIDEAYCEYATHASAPSHKDYASVLNLLGQFENLIITRTFSKAYALAAFRIGYAISSPEIAGILNRVRHPFNVNSLAQTVAALSLEDSGYLEQVVADNWVQMKNLCYFFEKHHIDYIPSAGNFVSMDCSELIKAHPHAKSVQAYYQYLLSEGVIVRPVANYKMPAFLRVSIGKESEIQRFIDIVSSNL